MRILLVPRTFLAMAGCSSDPSSEAPVELQAGLYQISVGGGTIVALKDPDRGGRACFDPDTATELVEDPLQTIAGSWIGCTTTAEPRKGNAISGRRMCEERRMPMRVTYTGEVRQSSFLIHGFVAQGSDESESRMHLGSGDFTIAGRRIGDCSP